jgi:dipeptidyl aminopeptidase/acylaminoacyl peptidase
MPFVICPGQLGVFLITVTLALATSSHAQSEEQIRDYFERFPEADANSDGTLTREEARAHRQGARSDPSQGDNLNSQSHIPGIDIPESVLPVKVLSLKSQDGVDLSFAYRVPKGDGPFPAILFFHGGGGHSNLQSLKRNLITQPIQTRFLDRGFVTIASTRRQYWKTDDGKPNGFYDAVEDAAKVVEKAKSHLDVNPDQVILYGGSGGAILAIATASKIDVACVVAGEPATIVPLDPREDRKSSPAEYRDVMADPAKIFTQEKRQALHAWMKNIDCPILLLQGKHEGLYKTNFEILIPELRSLGKDISSIHYADVRHGFYWGTVRTGATLETVERIMEDVTAFIGKQIGVSK